MVSCDSVPVWQESADEEQKKQQPEKIPESKLSEKLQVTN